MSKSILLKLALEQHLQITDIEQPQSFEGVSDEQLLQLEQHAQQMSEETTRDLQSAAVAFEAMVEMHDSLLNHQQAQRAPAACKAINAALESLFRLSAPGAPAPRYKTLPEFQYPTDQGFKTVSLENLDSIKSGISSLFKTIKELIKRVIAYLKKIFDIQYWRNKKIAEKAKDIEEKVAQARAKNKNYQGEYPTVGGAILAHAFYVGNSVIPTSQVFVQHLERQLQDLEKMLMERTASAETYASIQATKIANVLKTSTDAIDDLAVQDWRARFEKASCAGLSGVSSRDGQFEVTKHAMIFGGVTFVARTPHTSVQHRMFQDPKLQPTFHVEVTERHLSDQQRMPCLTLTQVEKAQKLCSSHIRAVAGILDGSEQVIKNLNDIRALFESINLEYSKQNRQRIRQWSELVRWTNAVVQSSGRYQAAWSKINNRVCSLTLEYIDASLKTQESLTKA